jgi:hypothetical protein
MKANELRIGNYINYGGALNIIIGIVSPSPQKRIELSDKYLVEINPPDSFYVSVEDISPIPLSKEILEKYGFEYWNMDIDCTDPADSYWVHKSNKFPSINNLTWRVQNVPKKLKKLNYLHELQNLFFSYTGEELLPNK